MLEVIEYLVRNRDRLVPREELQAAVWAGVRVEEDSLYRAIAIARRLLETGSGVAEPIQTVRGNGYRFAASVERGARAAPRQRPAALLPGRAVALAALEDALDRVRTGRREIVAVPGEAGIGKTRLVESFADVEFCAAELAAALAGDELEISERCDDLARAGVAEWPDGTLSERFRFRHALHRDVLYDRAAPARRRGQHRRIAEQLVVAYGERAEPIAAALAAHFEASGDAMHALAWYRAAIEAAARRHAGRDAHALAERALALLTRADATGRVADELGIRFALAPALPEALGFADPAVEANLLRVGTSAASPRPSGSSARRSRSGGAPITPTASCSRSATPLRFT